MECHQLVYFFNENAEVRSAVDFYISVEISGDSSTSKYDWDEIILVAEYGN